MSEKMVFIGGSYEDFWVVKDGDTFIMMRYLSQEEYPDNVKEWTNDEIRAAQDIVQHYLSEHHSEP